MQRRLLFHGQRQYCDPSAYMMRQNLPDLSSNSSHMGSLCELDKTMLIPIPVKCEVCAVVVLFVYHLLSLNYTLYNIDILYLSLIHI